MSTFWLVGLCCALLGCLSPGFAKQADQWDMAALRKPPSVNVVAQEGGLRSLYYEGETYKGKPTRVFAYLAYPEKIEKSMPAVVLVHGGGGKAFAQWAKLWAERGYIALAMDLFGQGPDGKHAPDGGPRNDPSEVFAEKNPKDAWPYQAAANVIRGISLLTSLPEVDPKRIGITGISWGGYLTCIVAGLDNRLRAAVPVYGCGYLHEATGWTEALQAMPEGERRTWVERFDPSSYLGRARMPTLFMSGTNDFAYWLPAYQKSYRLVKRRALCVTVRMPHSHEAGWAPKEIGLFMDSHLKGGVQLPSVRGTRLEGNTVEAEFRSKLPLSSAALCYTTDTCAWPERKWQSTPAKVDGLRVKAALPDARPIVYFLTATDSRGATVSTEHETILGKTE